MAVTGKSLPASMRRLEEHCARLFIADTKNEETSIDYISIGREGSNIRNLLGHEQVCEFFNTVEKEDVTHTCSIYLLRQKSSWSRLLITAADFYCLLKTNDVFPAYGDYISSFGHRSRDNDSRFGCYERFFNHGTRKLEICYNIRYPAKHDREGSSTPWSFRQVGVYHSLNLQTGKSVWILVQCPLSVQLLVDSVQKEDAGLGLHDDQPLILHYIILTEALSHWRDYGNYLEAKMQEINIKSQAFGSERILKHDYDVTFDDALDIQLMQGDMIKSKHAIDSALKIVAGLQLHQRQFLGVTQRNTTSDYDPIIVALESLSSRLDAESRGFSCLIDLSDGVKNQLHKILEYRHDVALQDNTLSLAQISKSSRLESMEMQKLAKESYKDSKSMRVLSFVALIYLPATLVLGIFSSSFIIETNSTSDPAKSHLGVSDEFWWFPALTLPLLLLTAGCAVAWSKWQTRRDSAKFTFNPATDG